jgi:RNA polymerase sigma factor (TIGR02999 family)
LDTVKDISVVLHAAAGGDPRATDQLLPLVYDHLRELARRRLSKEQAGQTLQPTALVHEAYMRLLGDGVSWNSRGHFFGAAAQAMRRILVERARAKKGPKRGGGRAAVPLSAVMEVLGDDSSAEPDWIALDEAMEALQKTDGELAQVVHLRYFAGLTVDETALATGRSARSVDREWKLARAWLLERMDGGKK